MVAGETRVVGAGFAKRRGRDPIALGATPPPVVDPDPTFVVGTTQPTRALNGPRISLDTFSGTGAGGIHYVTGNNKVYDGINFGTTRIKFTGACTGTIFRDCKWTISKNNLGRDATVIDMRAANVKNTLIEFCDFDQSAQGNPGMTGVMGSDFTIKRSNLRNFTDLIGVYMPTSSGGDLNVLIEANHMSAMAWYWNPNDGIVHPSDNKTHNDLVQNQGGYGMVVIGNYMDAHYSTTIGTGTPGSGSESVSGIGYTYAQGVSARYSIVEGGGTYSSGDPGAFLGGSISGLMYTNGSRGDIYNNTVTDNWCKGGAFFINAGASQNVSPWGSVYRNRFTRDQRASGWAIGIRSGVTVNVGAGTSNRNIWTDDGSEVARKNA